ncbi:MAG: hypothetical protein V5A66_00950 [Candidatus Thermoplasmatota archaeon]
MRLIKKIKNFFKGAFDYDNPSAGDGTSGAVSALSQYNKEYKKKINR